MWIKMWMWIVRVVWIGLGVGVIGVEGVGKGCIGLWQASDDLIMVSDSDYMGIHVVSLSRGETVERIPLSEMPVVGQASQPPKVNNAISLASCQKCNYLLYTHNHGRVYRIFFSDTVERLVQRNASFAEGAVVELVTFVPKKNQTFVPQDARGVLISSSGKNGWAVDGKSEKTGVYKWRIRGRKPGKPILTQRIYKLRTKLGFGVSFVAGSDENRLWIPLRRGKHMLQLRARDGALLQRLEFAAHCPNLNDTSRNFRQMYSDPLRPHHVLAIASTSDPWDAAIWKLDTQTNRCEFLVAETLRASGWVDGYGSHVHFTRSHFMYLLQGDAHRQDPKIIVSDIDNRSLRVVDVRTSFTYTIMYDRDRRLQQLQALSERLQTAFSPQQPQNNSLVVPINLVTNVTAQDDRAYDHVSLGLVSQRRNCQSQFMKNILETSQWAPSTSVLDGTSPVTVLLPKKTKWMEVPFAVAQQFCHDKGFRLCEPAELKRASRRNTQDMLAPLISWTKGECASCWKRFVTVECGLPPLFNFRTFDVSHTDNGGTTFFHTWNNGTAYEIGAARLPQGANTGNGNATSITFCPGTRNPQTGQPLQALAAAVCCVDCRAKD